MEKHANFDQPIFKKTFDRLGRFLQNLSGALYNTLGVLKKSLGLSLAAFLLTVCQAAFAEDQVVKSFGHKFRLAGNEADVWLKDACAHNPKPVAKVEILRLVHHEVIRVGQGCYIKDGVNFCPTFFVSRREHHCRAVLYTAGDATELRYFLRPPERLSQLLAWHTLNANLGAIVGVSPLKFETLEGGIVVLESPSFIELRQEVSLPK